jgi:predicted PurR-regulated permease PerM
MNIKLSSGSLYRAALVVAAAWIVHGFVEALLAACVTAIASWPLYRRFRARCVPRVGSGAAAVVFTLLMVAFVLAPMVFAVSAMLTETHALLVGIAAADKSGIGVPGWLSDVPAIGPWIAARWQHELAHPGALMMWTQRTDPTALLSWAQSLGLFMAHHAFIVGFAVLVLFYLYQEGDTLSVEIRRVLRDALGARAEGYVDVAVRAARGAVNSMLVVGLVDGLACGIAYAASGVPHAATWAAITGALAVVPFLGYIAVLALALQLSLAGATQSAVVALVLGCAVLVCGDKILRPLIAGTGVRLRFVWVLIGCLGGFEALGLVGLVIGPVVLALTRELWKQRVRVTTVHQAEGRPLPNTDATAMVP